MSGQRLIRIFYLIYFAILGIVLLIFGWLFKDMVWGFNEADCPSPIGIETISIHITVVNGDGQTIEGVEMHTRQDVGECLQGVVLNETAVSGTNGLITTTLSTRPGGPNIEIILNAPDYDPCFFTLSSDWSQRFKAQLLLADRMLLRGTITALIESNPNEYGEVAYNEDTQEFTRCTSA